MAGAEFDLWAETRTASGWVAGGVTDGRVIEAVAIKPSEAKDRVRAVAHFGTNDAEALYWRCQGTGTCNCITCEPAGGICMSCKVRTALTTALKTSERDFRTPTDDRRSRVSTSATGGLKARRKGKRGEREIVRLAREHGLKAQRTWQTAQAADPAARNCDVFLTGRSAQVNVARRGFTALYAALDGVALAFVRQGGKPWLAVVPAETLLELLRDRCREREW